MLHDGRAVHERIWSFIKVTPQALDDERSAWGIHSDWSLILHKAQEPHARDRGKGRETRNRNRPLKVDEFVTLPGESNSKAASANTFGPFCYETWIRTKIGDLRWNRIQTGPESVREAHERTLKIKFLRWIDRFKKANGCRQAAEKLLHVVAAEKRDIGSGLNQP